METSKVSGQRAAPHIFGGGQARRGEHFFDDQKPRYFRGVRPSGFLHTTVRDVSLGFWPSQKRSRRLVSERGPRGRTRFFKKTLIENTIFGKTLLCFIFGTPFFGLPPLDLKDFWISFIFRTCPVTHWRRQAAP